MPTSKLVIEIASSISWLDIIHCGYNVHRFYFITWNCHRILISSIQSHHLTLSQDILYKFFWGTTSYPIEHGLMMFYGLYIEVQEFTSPTWSSHCLPRPNMKSMPCWLSRWTSWTAAAPVMMLSLMYLGCMSVRLWPQTIKICGVPCDVTAAKIKLSYSSYIVMTMQVYDPYMYAGMRIFSI